MEPCEPKCLSACRESKRRFDLSLSAIEIDDPSQCDRVHGVYDCNVRAGFERAHQVVVCILRVSSEHGQPSEWFVELSIPLSNQTGSVVRDR